MRAAIPTAPPMSAVKRGPSRRRTDESSRCTSFQPGRTRRRACHAKLILVEHHIIPQFYLRGFRDPAIDPRRGARVWTADVKLKTVTLRSPKTLAKLTDYYAVEGVSGSSHVVETEILTKVEDAAAKVIAQLAMAAGGRLTRSGRIWGSSSRCFARARRDGDPPPNKLPQSWPSPLCRNPRGTRPISPTSYGEQTARGHFPTRSSSARASKPSIPVTSSIAQIRSYRWTL
jgi:uncharacterized protein DUF4238